MPTGDIETLDELEREPGPSLLSRMQATVLRHPALARMFDDAFLDKLSRSAKPGNYLLFLLCQRPGDHVVSSIWNTVLGDLDVLSECGSWSRFARRFRNTGFAAIQSARTELDLAARMRRAGFEIELEPELENGSAPEFSAATNPVTWWEVKQLLDEGQVRSTHRLLDELGRRIGSTKLPYFVDLDAERVDENIDVATFVRELKELMRRFADAGDQGQRILHFGGIRAAIGGRRRESDRAHLGVTTQSYGFDGTQTQRVRAAVASTREQLPASGGGVVVVDATSSEWLDVDTVEDACLGTEQIWYTPTSHEVGRAADGIFHPERNRRISAVIYYNQREFVGESTRYPKLVAFHNPFATKALPDQLLRGLGELPQFRYVRSAPRLITRERH